jgi:curved DNA-binding protein CbpA
MKYFNSSEDLKKQYRTWCKKLHPDHGGDPEAFREMMEEYQETQLHGFKKEAQAQETELTAELERALKKIVTLEGLEIDLVGSWLWVSGETFSFKDILKEAGFKWASKRKKWYFSEEKAKGKFKGDFEQLKAHHGFKEIKTNKTEKIA